MIKYYWRSLVVLWRLLTRRPVVQILIQEGMIADLRGLPDGKYTVDILDFDVRDPAWIQREIARLTGRTKAEVQAVDLDDLIDQYEAAVETWLWKW
nr:hypothetical protein [Anaerolineae bacterium]